MTDPAYAHKLPPSRSKLREALLAVLEASATLDAYYNKAIPAEREIDRLENRLFDTRQALYAALAEHGIDGLLAKKIGGVL